jgi:endonuclease/exonuclease/phosphatase family metal-dependent hydrolase
MKKWIILFVFFIFSYYAESAIHFASFNIRNFDYNERNQGPTDKKELDNLFIELNADLIAIQEIKSLENFEAFIKRRMPNFEVKLSECGGSGNQKLGFVYNKRMFNLLGFEEDLLFSDPVQSTDEACGTLRPLVIGKFENKDTKEKFYAISVHLKAGGDRASMAKRFAQYELVVEKIKSLKQTGIKKIVMMGDFNTTGYLSQNQDYVNFKEMLKNAKLTNATTELPCSVFWSGKNTYEQPSKLDHILITNELLNEYDYTSDYFSHCKKVSCEPSYLEQLGVTYLKVSDHCPIKAELE